MITINSTSLNNVKSLTPYISNQKIKINSRKIQSRFPQFYYENIKIDGLLAQEVDWEMCFRISFYTFITENAKEYFYNEFKLHQWLRSKKFGKFLITSEIRNKINTIPWWDFDPDTVVTFSHERDISVFSFCKSQYFELYINLFPPDTYQSANKLDGMGDIYIEACNWISKLNCFQNDEFIRFRSNKPKKNINTQLSI